MQRIVGVVLSILVMIGFAQAQETGDLIAEDITIEQGVDAFGQPTLLATGQLINQSENEAYQQIDLFAEVFDAAGTLIGEGFGYLVNACGVALTEFALQPSASQSFVVTLELYEEDSTPERVDIIAEGSAVDAIEDAIALPESVSQVTDDEVVAIEWIDAVSLRYGVGCANDVFTDLAWQEHNLNTGLSVEITHPNAARITDAFLQQTDLTNPMYYQHSFLTFSPTARRIVYQNNLNAFITAEPDGSFKRILYDNLFRHSLQGVLWQPEGVFLAYYFGAYGEAVLYFTATVDGQRLSDSIYENPPSLIVPGLTPDGREVVIATTSERGTGYYLQDAAFDNNELLFEGSAPSNNYPAPLYTTRASGDFIYLVRDVEDEPYLQCFDMQTRTLHDLVSLPLRLTSEARAWTWLSPDGFTLALAANGTHSGLWLIDLSAFNVCA